MSCCSSHKKQPKKKREEKIEAKPKNFISKYLYNLGKKDFEKGSSKSKKCH